MMTVDAVMIGGLRRQVARPRRTLRHWRTAAAVALAVAATLITSRAALDTALALPVLLAEVPQ